MIRRFAKVGVVSAFGLFGWSAGAVLTAAPASACLISPGTPSCAPDVLTVSPSAMLVSSKSGTITSSPPSWNASYTENVYRDPNNTLCNSPNNCLTWVIKLTAHINADSADTIERITISDFRNFQTDIGYINPPNTAPGMTNDGTKFPNNVSRNVNGSVLAWDFNTNGNPLSNGQTTVLLAVETSATQVVPGTISAQDGTASGDAAFGPAVPEVAWVPAMGLFGAALVGGWVYRRRRATR